MADHHHHHHQHRPHRLSVPPRTTTFSSTTTTTRPYPTYSYISTPTPTPSKQRLPSSLSLASRKTSSKSSLSFLFLLLFSLRSLYSLLPFLKASPPFSLFPFSFLVSLLSFLLSLSFSLFLPSHSSSKYPSFHFNKNNNNNYYSVSSISPSQHKLLLYKSLLLAVVFLLRFQALRFCGTAALILAELSGNVVARFVTESQKPTNKFSGFLLLFIGLSLLSISWDRIDCFPLSISFIDKYGFTVFPREKCLRIWSMLLPFSSGFLGCYERVSMNWVAIRQLGSKRVRLVSSFYTTLLLFIPAVISFIMFEKGNDDGVSIVNFGWPLVNTVVFGVLLSENYSEDKLAYSKDLQKEFVVTFVCTIVLELFYFPELSLWGLLLCGLLLYFAVRKLDPFYWNYLQLELESSEPLSTSIMKPIRHILSERKSRKIALFLLINTGYMVVEFVAGFMSNSLGLISDACHMLFDCAALAIGLYASYISRLPANNQFNYGRGRFEVLSGYVNAVFLVLVGALIVLESFERILDPQEISTNSLLTVSIGGLLVNVIGLIFFHEEHHHAHGGSGSCSHSHSHSLSHSDSHQHSHGHEGPNEMHHKCISVSYHCQEKALVSHCDNLEHHHSDHNDHDHTIHNHNHNHNHSNHSPHHDHSHLHEPRDHRYHDHDHGNSPHSHTHTHHSDSKSDFSLGNSGSQQSHKSNHRHIDHNMEGIFLHVLADTMGSVGVVISTLLIKYRGWLVADPACSIFISVLIVASVIPLLRNSAEILLQRVPRAHEKDLRVALNDIMKIKGVHGIQNFHVWSLTNADVVGTMHLHVSAETDKISVNDRVSHIFHDAGIKDLALQVECIK